MLATTLLSIGIIALAIFGMAIGLLIKNKVLEKGCGNSAKLSCLLCGNKDCSNAGNKE